MLVKCSVNGTTVPLIGGCISEDIFSYFSTATLVTQGNIHGGDVTLYVNGQPVQLKVTGYNRVGDTFETTCCPKQAWVHMNATCPCVMGKFTLKELLTKLKFSHNIPKDSSTSYWYVPTLGLRSIIDMCNAYAKYPNGAPTVYMDINGFIKCLDLKDCFKGTAVDLKGEIIEDTVNGDWVLNYPADVQVNRMMYDKQDIQKVHLYDDIGKGRADCFEVTGEAYNRLKTKIENQCMFHMYTSRVCVVNMEHMPPLYIGNKVTIQGYGPFVVGGINFGLPVAENQVAKTTLKLISPYL